MKVFVVAVPLFSAKMAVEAYRLCYQRADRLLGTLHDYTALSNAMSSPGLDLLVNVGLEPFTGGKPIFVDINQFQLLGKAAIQSGIPPKMMVCVLSADVARDAMFHPMIRELSEAGFPIAIDGLPYNAETDLLYSLADYAIIDATSPHFREMLLSACAKKSDMRVVFTDIPDLETFDRIKDAPRALFQGQFYTQPITKGLHFVTPLKINALRLLKMVTEENFELNEISDIIQKDPSISVALLKFINSPAIGLLRKVDSIRSAVALLGQKEVRKWVTAAISTQLSEDKPGEITKLSLVRAKFVENLAPVFGMAVQASTLFLMGLFSLLDVILDKTMEDALAEISIDQRVCEALLTQKGEFADVLALMYSYERADWQNLSVIIIRLGLSIEAISKAFVDALMWYRELLSETI